METIVTHSGDELLFDATDYLLSTKANKEKLDAAIRQAKNGEGVEIKLEDLWK